MSYDRRFEILNQVVIICEAADVNGSWVGTEGMSIRAARWQELGRKVKSETPRIVIML